MLLSDNTRVFYGRSSGQVEERYLANVFGTYRAILEEHLPVTVICDWNLTPGDLKDLKVLVLPNAASIDDRQAEAIRQFVAAGGGLVASLDTSLCDEFGDARNDFALADVLGVHHAGFISPQKPGEKEDLDINFAKGLDGAYWEQRKNVFDLKLGEHEMLSDDRLPRLVGTQPVTCKAPAVRVKPAEAAQIAATITPRGAEAGTEPSPAIVTHKFGKGRVVYLAAGIDSAYYSYAYPYQRILLASAIRWAASEKPPLEVQAPMCVHATTFRQHVGQVSNLSKHDPGEVISPPDERLLIHLFSDVNTTAFHGLPNDDVPLREETIPIHDIRVRLRGYAIERVHQEPEGKDLAIERDGDEIIITVPRLEVHSVVVCELGK
jgi:type 1 glutamine amidotransferase